MVAKASSTKSSESGDKTLLFMLKSGIRLTWRNCSSFETGSKVTIKTGQMGGLDNLSLDNQSGKSSRRFDGSIRPRKEASVQMDN